MTNALDEAQRLGFDTVQVFTTNQRQWRVTPLADEAREAWVDRQRELGWEGRTVAHDSYLTNLASPDDALWEKSIAMMREELARCEALRISRLVSHPGAHTGSGLEAGLERIATAYARLFNEDGVGGGRVTLCLENTAGGGSTIGRTFEELAELRERIIRRAGGAADGRVGFCLDTCHALAAGYDIRAEGDAAGVLAEFDRVCGLANLRVMHLNDSKGALGSRIDRHEHIGAGQVGKAAFGVVVNRAELGGVPMILETPKGDTPKGTEWDRVNLGRLRRLLRSTSEGRGRARASVGR